MYLRRCVVSMWVVGACLVMSPLAQARVNIDVQVDLSPVHVDVAPPAPRREVVPPPREGYQWRPGFWRWEGRRHLWAPGVWMRAQADAVWVADAWERDGRGWRFVPGHWEQVERDRDDDEDRDEHRHHHDSRRDEDWGRDEGQSFQVPPDRVPPRGSCKVWFKGLPPDRQSPPMNCDMARADAREWGGMVIWARGPGSFQDGRVGAEDFGPHHLYDVPPDRLPPPGMCRVWFDNVPPDRQPPAESCRAAIHHAREEGGRVLHMPGDSRY
ncbi:YXWGXW repeat-containing protein [Uliginosibacterium gangwonense]|uniref:YXWGXW repeat-containing protein n=1 Tax=Uliginosibacterium gangwonense TaxID=392736 RepID=UPI0003A2661A|nr:YXWGXW repeat-containing protein [Uliginosibacterium gangwonense]